MPEARSGAGPVAPMQDADVTLRPLPTSPRITGGFWAHRQQVNRDVTLPLGATRLREAGNLQDLELAAKGSTVGDGGAYRGPLFMDSDVYKWLEAIAWEHGREPSDHLLEELRTWEQAVAAAQEDDGYLNSYVQVTRGGEERYRDLSFSHELYCFGHLIQAAIAARRSVGETPLWDVAIKVADHLVDTFGPREAGKNDDIDGHPIIEMALVELYRETGDERYLALAEHFVNARGHGRNEAYGREPIYFSDRVPTREATNVEGHAVRAVYFASGVADVAAEGRDPDGSLARAQETQWDAMVDSKTYLTGGLGSRWDGEAFGDPFELPPDVAYCETCAAIGGVQWSWRRLLATGDSKHADLIERILFNGFLSGFSLSGDEFFYANSLQVRSGAVPDDRRQPSAGRQHWFGVACCPPNIMRTMSSLGSLLATCDAGGIQVQQYATAELGLPNRRLQVETEYPWDGRVSITVTEAEGDEWTLGLRIPRWCPRATLAVAGGPDEPVTAPEGYARVRREWNVGDTVVLTLPMPPRFTAPHPRVDAVRGCLAVERGPLVYALEQVDLPDGVVVDDVRLASTSAQALGTKDRPDLLGGIVTVTVPVRDFRHPLVREVEMVPYALWGNRGVGPMRVWIPVASGAEPEE